MKFIRKFNESSSMNNLSDCFIGFADDGWTITPIEYKHKYGNTLEFVLEKKVTDLMVDEGHNKFYTSEKMFQIIEDMFSSIYRYNDISTFDVVDGIRFYINGYIMVALDTSDTSECKNKTKETIFDDFTSELSKMFNQQTHYFKKEGGSSCFLRIELSIHPKNTKNTK